MRSHVTFSHLMHSFMTGCHSFVRHTATLKRTATHIHSLTFQLACNNFVLLSLLFYNKDFMTNDFVPVSEFLFVLPSVYCCVLPSLLYVCMCICTTELVCVFMFVCTMCLFTFLPRLSCFVSHTAKWKDIKHTQTYIHTSLHTYKRKKTYKNVQVKHFKNEILYVFFT